MLTIQNAHFQLAVNPQQAVWSLYGPDPDKSSLEDVRLGMIYSLEGKQIRALHTGQPLLGGAIQRNESIHGPIQALVLKSPADANGLRFSITFALPDDHPLALWKIQVENRGRRSVELVRFEMMKAGELAAPKVSPVAVLMGTRTVRKFPMGSVRPHANPGELAFFSNGWQTGSFAGLLGPRDRQPQTKLGFLRLAYEHGSGTPQPHRRGHFASDMFGILVDRTHRTGILAGFLSQKQNFGSLEVLVNPLSPVINMWANGDSARLNPGASFETDWACIQFIEIDQPLPLEPYLRAAARENTVAGGLWNDTQPGEGRSFSGWCSWYHFYTRVTAADIERNLVAAAGIREQIPLDLVQIDDGFESKVGDWYSFKPEFSQGLEPLAKAIRTQNFTSGLWLAPFIAVPNSEVIRKNPGWILRNRSGLPVNTGFLWETFPRALDLTVPEALEYAAGACRTASKEWGYPYLKLDFLFSASLPGRYHDPTRTRAQVLRLGLEAIRQAVGQDVYLLGCGCPLGPAIGLVDAMRIGPDVEQRWEPAHFNLKLPFKGEPGIPGAENAVRNTLTRAPFHNRWWVNDPDCLLLRESTHLTTAEVQSMAAVMAMTGGLLMISDDLPQVTPERLAILQAILPQLDRQAHLLDFFDRRMASRLKLSLNGAAGQWEMIGLFNWSGQPENLTFRTAEFGLDPNNVYLARSFWTGMLHRFQNELVFPEVPAHGSVVLAVRKEDPEHPEYLGSSLHLSQGAEVTAMETDKQGLRVEISRPGRQEGIVDLKLTREPVTVLQDDRQLEWMMLAGNVCRLKIAFKQKSLLEIRY